MSGLVLYYRALDWTTVYRFRLRTIKRESFWRFGRVVFS